MAEPSKQLVRRSAFAGSFYPANPDECRSLARSYVDVSAQPAGTKWMGGVVPHAGWICSGAIAGQTIAAIAQQVTPDVVVIFGAIHTPITTDAALLDRYARWDWPGESCAIADEVRRKILESGSLFRQDDRFHDREHAVEVELPLIRAAWPASVVLPVEVPADDQAANVGRVTAKVLAQTSLRVVFLASSDLTHYGKAYRFAPAGVGLAGLEWAKGNDQLMIDRILRMQEESIVPEVRARRSACGGGAIAAMLAACKEHGASSAKLLRHASSFETLAAVAPQPPDNAVGYASIVIG